MTRALVVLFALVALPVSAQTQWITANRVSVPASSTTEAPQIFVNTANNFVSPNQGLAPGVWHTIDLADGPQWALPFAPGIIGPNIQQPNIPESTVAVVLSDILIVTNASNLGTPVICDLTATFRAPGSTLTAVLPNYQLQTMAIPGDGARSNAFVTVPVVDRKFEMQWNITPGCTTLPTAAAINLHVHQVLWNAPDGAPVPTLPNEPPAGAKWFRVCDEAGCYEGKLPPGRQR